MLKEQSVLATIGNNNKGIHSTCCLIYLWRTQVGGALRFSNSLPHHSPREKELPRQRATALCPHSGAAEGEAAVPARPAGPHARLLGPSPGADLSHNCRRCPRLSTAAARAEPRGSTERPAPPEILGPSPVPGRRNHSCLAALLLLRHTARTAAPSRPSEPPAAAPERGGSQSVPHTPHRCSIPVREGRALCHSHSGTPTPWSGPRRLSALPPLPQLPFEKEVAVVRPRLGVPSSRRGSS